MLRHVEHVCVWATAVWVVGHAQLHELRDCFGVGLCVGLRGGRVEGTVQLDGLGDAFSCLPVEPVGL